jgi:hypothetical protein
MKVAVSLTPSWRVALRQLDHIRLVFDAERLGAALRRRDHRAAVARAQIHHVVVGRDLGRIQHLVDQRLRRRHPDDVLAFLADLRLEFRFSRLRLRAGAGSKYR